MVIKILQLRGSLEQVSTNFFCKGPEGKYFRFCGPEGLCPYTGKYLHDPKEGFLK